MSKLRIACLAKDHSKLEPWAMRLLAKLHGQDDCQLVTLIQGTGENKGARAHPFLRMVIALETLVFARPTKFDDHTGISESLPKVIASHEHDLLRAENIDIIVDLDCSGAGSGLINLSRYGVWYLDIFYSDEGVPGFWAASGKQPVSSFMLYCNSSKQKDRQVISSGSVNSKFIAARNMLSMKENAIPLILREISRLGITGKLSLQPEPQADKIGAPQLGDIIFYLTRMISIGFKRVLASFATRIGGRPDMFFFKTGQGSILSFDPNLSTDIMPDGHNYWADPFLWEKEGQTYCFFENYDYKTRIGRICVGRFEGDDFTFLGDALNLDYHLSFPFLFERDNELFMIPETHEVRRIEIWRCTDFPHHWEPHETILNDVDAADSSLLSHDNKLWLFTNIASDVFGDNCNELHIFELDSKTMQVISSHRLNPVVMNSRTARNAGRIHLVDGRLYRPSQDNAYGQYGYGLNIMEIETLTLNDYDEKRVTRIDPGFDKALSGCHHIDALNGFFIIDAQQRKGGFADK